MKMEVRQTVGEYNDAGLPCYAGVSICIYNRLGLPLSVFTVMYFPGSPPAKPDPSRWV